VAFGAEASGAFAERAGLVAAAGAFRAFAVRDDEAALRGAGAALPRADLAFSFSRVAFSLSLRAVSFSRIAASAAFATCDRPASGVESKVSKKALTTLLVPRGADVSDFAIELCPPTLAGITLICCDRTKFRRSRGFLACVCFLLFAFEVRLASRVPVGQVPWSEKMLIYSRISPNQQKVQNRDTSARQ
jgi:hypothetical protein